MGIIVKSSSKKCLVHVLFFAIFALLPLPGISSPSTYTATISDARGAVEETMKKTGASSISIALIEGERIVWAEGSRSFGKVRILSEDSVARIAPGRQTLPSFP